MRNDQLQKKDDLCASKAKQRKQQTFTIVEQDRSNAKTIAFWILQNIETCTASKLRDALEIAIHMRTQPRKYAD
jgi:ribosomal protein L10